MANYILPGVYETISNGNLDIVSGSQQNIVLKLGACTGGTVNVPAAYGSQDEMIAALGAGPLVENLAYEFSVSGGPVLAMPVNTSQAGSVGLGGYSGSGGGTIAISIAPWVQIAVKVTTGGAGGKLALALDGGAYGAPQSFQPSTDGYQLDVPGTFTTLTFSSAGANFVTGDVYTFGIDGTVTHTGSGSGTITQTSAPIDNYTPSVVCTSAGSISSNPRPKVVYSLDATSGNAGAVVQLTSGGVLPLITPDGNGTGLVLTFTGTFAVGDGYSFLACGPAASVGDITSACNAIPQTLQFSMIESVRGPMVQNSQVAVQEAAVLSETMSSLFGDSISARSIMSCPTVNGASVGVAGGSVSTVNGTLTVDSVDTDGYIDSSFVAFSDPRVIVAPGDELLTSAINGLSLRRPASWVLGATLSNIPPSQSAAWVGAGALKGVTKLFRNEALEPGLGKGSGQRFTALRTVNGRAGFFFTDAITTDALNSPFSKIANCRVMDKAANIAYQWGTPLINQEVNTTTDPNAVPGSISASNAAQLDASLTGELSTQMVPGDCVAVKGAVNRTHDIESDDALPSSVAVQFKSYSAFIEINLAPAKEIS